MAAGGAEGDAGEDGERGMVRFAAQQDIRDWRELRGFNRLGYEFREEYSSESQLVFVKKKD